MHTFPVPGEPCSSPVQASQGAGLYTVDHVLSQDGAKDVVPGEPRTCRLMQRLLENRQGTSGIHQAALAADSA